MLYNKYIENGFSFLKTKLLDVFERWDPDNGAYSFDGTSPGAAATGGIGGAIAGGLVGAKGGAGIGMPAGPVGSAAGAIIGGLGGAAVGLFGGGVGGNTAYDIRNNNGAISFVPGSGLFYKYNNTSGTNKDLVDHIFWNSNTGDVYYLDPDSRTYARLDTTGIDTSGGLFKYASDDLLDAMSNAIAGTIKANRNSAILRKELEAADLARHSGVFTIPVPTPMSPDSIQQQEYTKRKAEADQLLQKMLTTDPDIQQKEDNTVYYKLGPNEIDLKYYIHNLGTNLLNYINSKDWNQAQKDAFINSYEQYKLGLQNQLSGKSSRFYTDDAGVVRDNEGILGASSSLVFDADGNAYNSLDDITDKKTKKSAYEFSPDAEVAEYLNTIGQAIVNSGKVKTSATNTSGDFDVNKHGFINYWLNKINPIGGNPDIDPYLALDPVGPDGKRERKNRIVYLAHELTNYLNQINKGNISFENSNFKTKEAYVAKVQQAIDNLKNGWDTTDPASLLAIGITPDFYNALMTDVANPLMSDAELEAELQKNKAKAESDYIEQVKGVYDRYVGSTRADLGVGIIKDARYEKGTPGSEQRTMNALDALGYPVDEASLAMSVDTLWETVKSALRSGQTVINTPAGQKNILEVLPIILPLYQDLFTASLSNAGVSYLNDPQDARYGAILCIKNGRLYYDFIGNIKESQAWQQLKSDFNRNYVVLGSDKPKYSFDKLGGVLKKLQEGGNLGLDAETMAALLLLAEQGASLEGASTETEISLPTTENMSPGAALTAAIYGPRHAAADARHMSYDQWNKKQRTPNGSPNPFNKDNGIWKTGDFVRLGAIAADIASIPLPTVAGAAVGFGGTLANLWADWADDSVTTGELIKNLGANLGLDALSIIPVFGDVADAGRLTRNLVKMAPKIGYALTAYGLLGTLKNGLNIMDSLAKVTSDEKLNVGDYQNIAQAIAALAGVSGGVKAGVAKKLAKNNARQTDAVGIGLRKKLGDTLGESLDFIFQGDKAKELKKLIDEGNIDAVNAKIKEFEGFSDYEVNTYVSNNPIKMQSPITRTKGDDGKKHWGTQNPLGISRKIDSFEIYDPSKLRGGYASQNLLHTGRLDAVSQSNIYGGESLKTKAEVDAIVDAKVKEDAAEALAVRDKRLADIQRTNEELNGVKNEDGSFVTGKEGISEKKSAAELELANHQAQMQQMLLAYDSIDPAFKGNSVKVGRRTYYKRVPPGSKQPLIHKRLKKLQDEISKKQAEFDELNDFLNSKTNKGSRLKELKDKYKKNSRKELEALREETSTQLGDLHRQQEELTNWVTERNRASALKQQLLLASALEAVLQQKVDWFENRTAELENRLKVLSGEVPNATGTTNSRAKEKFINSIQGRPYMVEYAPGHFREVKDIKRIIDEMNLLKKGGRLLFLKYAGKFQGKFANRKTIGNVTYSKNAPDWQNDFIFDNGDWSEEARNTYGGITEDSLGYYNDLQDSYRNVFAPGSTSPRSGHGNNLAYSKATEAHLGRFENLTELNSRFLSNDKQRSRLFGTLPGGGSTDTESGNWRDGAAGSMTYLRHLGNRLEHVGLINNANILGKGVEAYWDANKQMVKFRVKGQLGEGSPNPPVSPNPSPAPAPEPTTPPGPIGTDPALIGKQPIKKGPAADPGLLTAPTNPSNNLGNKGNKSPNISGTINNVVNGITDYLPNPFDYLRYKLLDRDNARKTLRMLDKIHPLYQKPKIDNVLVHSSLPDEVLAEQTYARLTAPANKAITSDGSAQMRFKMQSHANAANAMVPLYTKSTDMYRATLKADQELRKENHLNAHTIHDNNMVRAFQVEQDKARMVDLMKAQHMLDRDAFLLKWQYDIMARKNAKGELPELLSALQRESTLNNILDAVKNNPNNYGVNLSSQELSLYNKARTLGTSQGLSSNEIAMLQNINERIAKATKSQIYAFHGVLPDAWTEDANMVAKRKAAFNPTLSDSSQLLLAAKNGTKLKIAKMRERIKNADRFLRSIEKQLNSLDKKLDRVLRSMYGLPKSEIVKQK